MPSPYLFQCPLATDALVTTSSTQTHTHISMPATRCTSCMLALLYRKWPLSDTADTLIPPHARSYEHPLTHRMLGLGPIIHAILPRRPKRHRLNSLLLMKTRSRRWGACVYLMFLFCFPLRFHPAPPPVRPPSSRSQVSLCERARALSLCLAGVCHSMAILR